MCPLRNRPHLVKELIHSVEQKHVPGKVIAVGHSLGGYLSFLASRQRPDLFHSVIMLDSPVMPPWRAHIFAAMKRVGLDDLVTPARASRKRRQEWANVAEAYRFFKSKPAFALWDDDCLRDYVVRVFLGARGSVEKAVVDSQAEAHPCVSITRAIKPISQSLHFWIAGARDTAVAMRWEAPSAVRPVRGAVHLPQHPPHITPARRGGERGAHGICRRDAVIGAPLTGGHGVYRARAGVRDCHDGRDASLPL